MEASPLDIVVLSLYAAFWVGMGGWIVVSIIGVLWRRWRRSRGEGRGFEVVVGGSEERE